VERFATDKELLRMTQLTADSGKVFPPDFAAVVPKDVLTKVSSYVLPISAFFSKLKHIHRRKT
jgi:hypothetical protein